MIRGFSTLYVEFRGGTATIRVPSGAEVHRLKLIGVSDLRGGMHVVVRGIRNADGSTTAASITVYK